MLLLGLCQSTSVSHSYLSYIGTVLASMPAPSGACNITFVVTVKEPTVLTTIMKGYFKVDVSSSDISVVLAKPVDVEQLYHLSVSVLFCGALDCLKMVHRKGFMLFTEPN